MLELYLWLKCCILNPSDVTDLPLPNGVEEALLEEADIQKLLDYGYILELGRTAVDAIKSTVRVFTVTQESSDQQQRRVIFCPDGVNSVLIDAGFNTPGAPVNIPNVDEQKSGLFFLPGALCADGTAFYTQFPSGGSGEFIFQWRGRLFACASICTGQRQCVCLAQIVLIALANITLRFFGNDAPLRITPYIDNVRFAGPQDITERAWEIFRERAARCGLTFEMTSAWAQKYVFLGIEYNHSEGTAKLGPKCQRKLSELASLHETPHWSMADFLSLFGLLVWGTTVLEICPAEFYHVFKFIRRRSDLLLEDDADVWPCVYATLRHWIHKLQSKSVNLRTTTAVPDQNVFVFTDACPSGYGVLIFADSYIYITAGRFQRIEDIFILEARAFLFGLQFLTALFTEGKITRESSIHFRIDNTSVIGACSRERSSNFTLNAIILRLHHLLQNITSRWDLQYVRSLSNISDPISRLNLRRQLTTFFTTEEE